MKTTTEPQISEIHGALCTQHLSVAQQRLYANCLEIIQKEQWPHNCPNLTHPLQISCLGSDARSFFWKLQPEPKTVCELKVALEKTWEIFLRTKLGPEL